MSEAISSDVIKKTQSTLGKFVKKPPLSDKLLSKPPFRFLHDVIMAVMRNTGFFKGLYSKEELNSENVKERDNKIVFLQKTIEVVKMVTGKPLTVRPSKIISGHEPEKTNELLQAIGFAIENNLSSTDATNQILRKISKKDGNTTDRKSTRVSPPKISPPKTVSSSKTSSKSGSKPDATRTKQADSRTEASNKRKIDSKTKDKPLEVTGKKEVTKSTSSKETKNLRKPIKPDAPRSAELEAPGKAASDTEEVASGPKLDRQKTEIIDPVKIPSPVDISNDQANNDDSKPPIEEKSVSRKSSLTDKHHVPEKPNSRKSSITDKTELLQRQRSRADSLKPSLTETIKSDKSEVSLDSNINLNNEANTENKSVTSKHESKSEELRLSCDGMHLNSKLPSNVDKAKEKKIEQSFEKNENTTHIDENSETISNTSKQDAEKPIAKEVQMKSARPPSVRPKTSLRPPSVRPVSARPGAPRIRDKHSDIVIEPEETTTLGKINVTLEVFDGNSMNITDDVDDAEDLVVIETKEDTKHDKTEPEASQDGDTMDENGRGRLVGQILSTQRALGQNTKPVSQKDNESTSVSKTDLSALDALRNSVQNLSGAALPLGRLLDFLQEDADSMRRELRQWRDTYTQTVEELKKDTGITEKVIQPLKHQLAQLETQISEQRELIHSSKANVLKQEEKIRKILYEC
ncbi:TRAF3-interacting protein 1-like [Ctenocephalides felis]|uniref:TRAF3-interacting protein 1-like n=1 Tax=Ctenocephalides felis TaxID=7515 RepID=UPI000E6E3BFF|nr:TRAF3-interacting protein 1-like [Ctenocephalides felis]